MGKAAILEVPRYHIINAKRVYVLSSIVSEQSVHFLQLSALGVDNGGALK